MQGEGAMLIDHYQLQTPLAYPTTEAQNLPEQMAPAFQIRDHAGRMHHSDDLLGEHGLLIGFVGDIWKAANIRRIIWLQKNSRSIMRNGAKLALIARDEPHVLYGYHISSLTPLDFPLFSDLDGRVHRLFNLSRFAGMVAIDPHGMIRQTWIVPDERVWPRISDITQTLESF
jgi:peroxiredoxin